MTGSAAAGSPAPDDPAVSTASGPAVHQVLATLGYGDAIGHEVLGIQKVLRAAGYRSDIFVETADSRLEDLTRDYRALIAEATPETVLIHHFSIGSRASRVAYALPGRMVLVYHNITPPVYFAGVHPLLVELCYLGRRELGAYASRCALALGDSEFNRQELVELGFPRDRRPAGRTELRPPRRRARSHHGGRLRRRLDQPPVRRPRHPEQEDRGRHPALPRLQDAPQPAVAAAAGRLVGGFERYFAMLQKLIADLGAHDVHFLGHVTNAELAAYYEVADLFLCASEHEGFCVPLMEAFHVGVPVVAYAATAIPATMDGGGVLYHDTDPAHVAALVDAVVSDADLEARSSPRRTRRWRVCWPAISAAWSAASSSACWRCRRSRRRRSPSTSGIASPHPAARGAAPVPAGRLRRAAAPGRRRQAATPLRRAHDRSTSGCRPPTGATPSATAPGGSATCCAPRATASDLFALTIDDDLRDDVRPFADEAARRGDVTIFHFALPSPMTGAFATLPGARVLQYHNITPAHFFAGYDANMFRLATLGRQRARHARRPRRSGARRLRFQPPRARGDGLRPDRRDAHRHRPVAHHRRARARPALSRLPRRWPGKLPVRRPHRAQQAHRGPYPTGRALQALCRRLLPLHLRRQDRRGAAATTRRCWR